MTRILYVEDDDDHRELVTAFLGDSGFDVTALSTGGAACVALAEGDYDLLLADLTLPDCDGWEVARTAKARTPSMPVVILTGWSALGLRSRPGVDSVLCKPISPMELVAKLKAVLP